jgi:hypothetical protein
MNGKRLRGGYAQERHWILIRFDLIGSGSSLKRAPAIWNFCIYHLPGRRTDNFNLIVVVPGALPSGIDR